MVLPSDPASFLLVFQTPGQGRLGLLEAPGRKKGMLTAGGSEAEAVPGAGRPPASVSHRFHTGKICAPSTDEIVRKKTHF